MSIENARAVRASRAQAMVQLAQGHITLAEVLRDPPEALGGVDLWPVLLKCPRMGRDRARVVCERARVWPHLRLNELSKAQRRALIESLPKKEA